MQPEQSRSALAQIVSARARGQLPCPAKRSASAACCSKGEDPCSTSIVLVMPIAPIYSWPSARSTAGNSLGPIHRRVGLRQILQCVGQMTDEDRLVRSNLEPNL